MKNINIYGQAHYGYVESETEYNCLSFKKVDIDKTIRDENNIPLYQVVAGYAEYEDNDELDMPYMVALYPIIRVDYYGYILIREPFFVSEITDKIFRNEEWVDGFELSHKTFYAKALEIINDFQYNKCGRTNNVWGGTKNDYCSAFINNSPTPFMAVDISETLSSTQVQSNVTVKCIGINSFRGELEMSGDDYPVTGIINVPLLVSVEKVSHEYEYGNRMDYSDLDEEDAIEYWSGYVKAQFGPVEYIMGDGNESEPHDFEYEK